MPKTKPKEFRWGTHFKNGKLYVFDKGSVLVARPWPELRAWRLTTSRRVWCPVRPEINVRTASVSPHGTPRTNYPPIEWVLDEPPPPAAVPPAEEVTPEKKSLKVWFDRKLETNRVACEQFFAPMPDPGHPDHDVAWALSQRVAHDLAVPLAWEYSLYGWTGRDVRFLNGLWLVPGDEVLELNSEEALAKERLLQCYAQEYPRILHRCPMAGETFRRSRPSQGVGQTSRPEPGWTCRLREPVPSEVDHVIAEILA